jgi:uncharacterized RDD family membrane protein YckC
VERQVKSLCPFPLKMVFRASRFFINFLSWRFLLFCWTGTIYSETFNSSPYFLPPSLYIPFYNFSIIWLGYACCPAKMCFILLHFQENI